jgi:predicted ATPase
MPYESNGMLILYQWRLAGSPSDHYVCLPRGESELFFKRAYEWLSQRDFNDSADLLTSFPFEIVHPPGQLDKRSLRVIASDLERLRLRSMPWDVFRELARAMGNAGCYLQLIFAEPSVAEGHTAVSARPTESASHLDPVLAESKHPSNNIGIRISGKHASIGPLLWEDIPPLAVVTGVNGAGKSQLLQVIASSCSASNAPTIIDASAKFDGEHYDSGEVFYSAGKWETISSTLASETRIREAIQEVQVLRRNEEHEPYIARKLGISVDALREMTSAQFQRVLTPGMLWTYAPEKFHSISLLFLAHRYFEREAHELGENIDVAIRRIGEPPWDLLSSVIKAAGLAFTFNIPPPLRPSSGRSGESFNFQLRDRDGNAVPMNQLSDGERVLLATSVWRYHADLAGRYHRLFLLDEPDAHLHPSLTRRFLNILTTAFIRERGARVILTTHSPSTVALAPEGSLFQMQREQPRISRVSRADAIALLTDGFVAVQDSTRTVFLEGKSDPLFYQGIWQRIIEQPVSGQPGRLKPYPNLHFVYGQGKPTIMALVPQLRASGFKNFLGVIDRDVANQPGDGVFVLERYSIENYLYDPLNIFFYLKKLGRAPSLPMDQYETADLLRSPLALQSIVDTVVAKVEAKYPPSNLKEAERVSVTYADVTLSYPSWVFTWSKRQIKDQLNRVFTQFQFEELITNYLEIGLIPDDIVALYRQLQGTEHGVS